MGYNTTVLIIVFLLICNTANAGFGSALVGGIVGASLASGSSKQSENYVPPCMIIIYDEKGNEIAIDYNNIKSITSDHWNTGWNFIYYRNSEGGVYTTMTPSQIVILGNKTCNKTQ